MSDKINLTLIFKWFFLSYMEQQAADPKEDVISNFHQIVKSKRIL